MPFIDQALLKRVAYGFHGGPMFATTRVTLFSGRTKRNAERSLPVHRFVTPYSNIAPEHRDEVIATFMACLGPDSTFRFKDYSDFELDDVIIGTAIGGVDETMQLVKLYPFGPETLSRKITKPVAAVTLTEDNGALASTTNLLTGVVTFTSSVGKIIRATGTFDVPVYFDDDILDFDFTTWQALSTELVLMEDTSEND